MQTDNPLGLPYKQHKLCCPRRSGDYDDCSGAIRDFSLKSHPLQQVSAVASPHRQQAERPQPVAERPQQVADQRQHQQQPQQQLRQAPAVQSRPAAVQQASTPRKQPAPAGGAAARAESDDDGDFSAVSDTNETEVSRCTA